MKLITTLIAAAILSGCAVAPRGAQFSPLVDMQGHTPEEFATDLRDCQAYAKTQPSGLEGAVAGAIAIGLISALLAPRGYKNYAAGVGGTLGAGAGTAGALTSQENIIRRCLAGRNWNVLS